ncbi:MAG: TIGR02556 family CRISPR-associated protein [bacterium]
MLSAIKDIGNLVSEKSWTNTKLIEGKIISILIDPEKESYMGIDIEDFDSTKTNLYLYKSGSSKGNVSSPFCPLTEPQKTYKKIEGWMKQCDDLENIVDTDKLIIGKIIEILNAQKGKIIAELDAKTVDISKKVSKFLTLKLDGKYLGAYKIFDKCLERFDEVKKKRSASTGVCSICSISGKEVSGKTDVFRFYTIDKPGFITGGFEESEAWKNYPVCGDCKTLLEKGRQFIDTKLFFKFYGLGYSLIPRILISNNNELEEILDILSDSTKVVSLKERLKKKITNDENEILEYLSEKKDILTLNFLFLQKQQSAERILLLIEDVFPSRIKNIFDAKDYIDKIFENDFEHGFNFGTIRTFFSKSDENKRESDLNKYFLEIVDSVFKGRKLNLSFLTTFHMAVIRKEFVSDGYFSFRVKDALMNILFFEYLNLIIFKEVEIMEENIFSSVFTRYGKTFGSSAKRGIFLLGSLTQLLLQKQWSDRDAKPFMKKLKGLKMGEKDIKALLPEVQNKLEEYDSFDKGKKQIASEISNYLLDAGNEWKMSTDEINFYFACGMNLADKIADIVYSKTN